VAFEPRKESRMPAGHNTVTWCFHLPDGVDISGDLPPDTRERLTAVVLAGVADAIRSAAPGETVAPQPFGRPDPRERFDPARRLDGYATPSYDDGSGNRVSLPLDGTPATADDEQRQRERAAERAYYTSTRQSRLDLAAARQAKLSRDVHGMTGQQIQARWADGREAFTSVALSPGHGLSVDQIFTIWRLDWNDRWTVANETAHRIARRQFDIDYGEAALHGKLGPEYNRAVVERAAAEAMFRQSYWVWETLTAAAQVHRNLTLDEINAWALVQDNVTAPIREGGMFLSGGGRVLSAAGEPVQVREVDITAGGEAGALRPTRPGAAGSSPGGRPGLARDFAPPDDLRVEPLGPPVAIPANRSGEPARVLEVSPGAVDTSLGRPATATSQAGAPSPRRIGFGPPGGAPATSDIGPDVALSRPTAGFGRPVEPRPSGVSGPGTHQLPAARQVGAGGDAATGEGGNVTSMSAGKRPGRGGGRRPPPLTQEEFERWERVPDDDPNRPPEQTDDTLHFGERSDERGQLAERELHREQQAVPRSQRANDGIARVLKEGENNYTVIIRGRDGGGVTVIRRLTREQVRGFSDRYGWNPPW
jgi:hypothetical protein